MLLKVHLLCYSDISPIVSFVPFMAKAAEGGAFCHKSWQKQQVSLLSYSLGNLSQFSAWTHDLSCAHVCFVHPSVLMRRVRAAHVLYDHLLRSMMRPHVIARRAAALLSGVRLGWAS